MGAAQRVAEALERVHAVAKEKGGNIVQSSQMSRGDRELLVRTEWLKEIIKGWYMLVRPGIPTGESSSWYANFWIFLRIYLEHHLGREYCLSAENSLDLHTKSLQIPKRVVVISAKGGSVMQMLPFDTSVLIYADPNNLPEERTEVEGLQVMPLPYALCKVGPTFFEKSPHEAEIALRLVASSSDLVQVILKHQLKRASGRLIGAYRFLKEEKIAEELKEVLSEKGFYISEENPFHTSNPLTPSIKMRSSYAGRIFSLWGYYRETVMKNFPAPPGLPKERAKYLSTLESLYEQDAYHSLSIEGYHVDAALIARVQNQEWNPDVNKGDRASRDALAARGYFEAFAEVKKVVAKILEGEPAGEIVEKTLPKWYRKLFGPSAQAGILREEDLFGYRKAQVYIRNSRHVPPPKEALLDAMEAFFECLKNETHPAVRAVLGHYLFVFIHPYMDGNGRLGRFLMNVMLASGGYPWTIIQVKHRTQYLDALEVAGTEQNIVPFARFIADQLP